MPLDENKNIIRNAIETVNRNDLSAIDDFLAPDFFDHTNQWGREGVREFYPRAFEAVPDYHRTILDIIAEGDKVWVFTETTGIHTGEWNILGVTLPPTDNKLSFKGINVYRIVDGKIKETWSVTDRMSLLTQLGVIECKRV
jgi:predicted ester cyclase